ncbi:hypothetical protein [Gordonia polyisoprenivorans]|uniref:hypothetical protein n=1 Tax=Gordonia polyisoprenivorans TaxID=84595 RepID=UPI001AD6B386|nr:hypothetical protein [Gordonia polyisoprenivorans]QTI68741.1 hypothetical protein J6U32_25315 [Gordonia polyisoprenivorans]
MIEPQGPLPPEIYWRRRIVAGGVLVAVLALVVGLVVWAQSGGGDDTSNTASKATPSSTTPSTATTNASVDPSQAPSGGGTGGGGGGAPADSSANPSAPPSGSAAVPAPGGNPAAADANMPLCPDNSIAVVLYTDKPTYTTGSQPVFTIVVTNAGLSACARDVGKAAQNVIVRTLDGTRTLWTASDCSQINTANNQVLQPQQQVKDTITWSGTTSNPGCDKPRTPVPAGSYQAIGKLGEKESAPITFNFVAPAQP